jgi:tetratricopeptide (TPR) repeat protein
VTALHHEASGEAGRAVAHRLAAGDQAQRLHAQVEAMEHWQQGLADGPTPSQAMALHLRLMRTAGLLDQLEASLSHVANLRALAGGGMLGTAQRVDALVAVAGHLARNQRAPESLSLVEGLPAALDERQQALVMAVRAVALLEIGRVDDAAVAARAALAMPGMQGQDRANLLDSQVLVEHRAGRVRAAFELNEASITLCRQLDDDFGVVRGLYRRGAFLVELDDLDGAEHELQRAAEQCARLGITSIQRAIMYSLCCVHSSRARQEQALATLRQGWALQPAMPAGEWRVAYRLAFVVTHMAMGDLGAAWLHAAPAVDEALAINEPYTVASVAISGLDLFGLLGETDSAARIVAALGDEVLRQMPQVAIELHIARARFELKHGDVAAAAKVLAQVPAPSEIVNASVRLRFQLAGAELALAMGEASRAWSMLPAPDTSDVNGLTVRVRAEAVGGALQPATVSAAQAALGAGSPHASAALHLHRALAAAQRAGVAGVPVHAQRDCAAHVARLADSLRAHPEQQAAFLRRYA